MTPTLRMQSLVGGEGTTLVLVGGGLTGYNSWKPFVELFAAQRRQPVLLNLIAVQYGLEDRPLPVDYSIKTESKALAAALDSLGYTQPLDLVAWSLGGMVTLDYALDHPDRVRTLTLIEPPAFWVLREDGPLDAETQQTIDSFQTLHGDITEDMLEQFLRQAGFAATGQSPRDLAQWNQWLPYRQSLRNTRAVIAYNDKLERVRQFKGPVLMIKGTGSAPFLHKITDILASTFPHARIIEMPGGHAPHLVSRDRFLEELERFQKEKN